MPGLPTYLVINGITIDEDASRGINFNFTPIPQASQIRRDCQGNLVDISNPQFRKYRLSVECTDQNAPVLNDIWPGFTSASVVIPPHMGVNNASDGTLTLEMMVISWSTRFDEFPGDLTWQMELEEV